MGYLNKLNLWVPYQLKESHIRQRFDICDLLIKHNKNSPFLKQWNGKKWICYNNIQRKRSWCKSEEAAQTSSKADKHQKKVMLCVWWDYQGIIYFEILSSRQRINFDIYINQLTKLNTEIQEIRPKMANRGGIVFHHDNAKPHTSLAICFSLCKTS